MCCAVLSCFTHVHLCLTLHCNQPGSSAHGDSPGKKTGMGYCAHPTGSPDPGIKPTSLTSPAVAGGFFTTSATWETPSYMRMFTQIYLYIY